MNYFIAKDEQLLRVGFRADVARKLIDTFLLWQSRMPDGGMQLAVFRGGQPVVSLWGGTDHFSGRPIERESLFPLLSATKGLATLALLHLHGRGYFAWDDRICQYWPAFGVRGKHEATIAHLLSHRVGLPNLTAHWRHWPDRTYMVALVEQATPAWPPGARYGYHGGSWGVMVDELVRRWTGQETGQVLREALAAPLGLAHCYIGLPRQRYRDVARLAFIEPEQRRGHPRLAPFGATDEHNSPEVLMSCQSSSGGVASAENLAYLYNLAAYEGTWRGDIYWHAADQREASRARNDLGRELPAARPELQFAWGLGFMTSPSPDVFGTRSLGWRTIGHPGASGAIGYADPDYHVSLGFTINGVGGQQMYSRYRTIGDLMRAGLVDAD
jgi:CubicO group peptidase (beta-lactamase class C family)